MLELWKNFLLARSRPNQIILSLLCRKSQQVEKDLFQQKFQTKILTKLFKNHIILLYVVLRQDTTCKNMVEVYLFNNVFPPLFIFIFLFWLLTVFSNLFLREKHRYPCPLCRILYYINKMKPMFRILFISAFIRSCPICILQKTIWQLSM